MFLTSKDDETDELIGLRRGADDFIRKQFSQRLVLKRIRAVLRRHSFELDGESGLQVVSLLVRCRF